ncbi:MAG: hypothetical protein M3442_17695 [Chloroflexota bacterium]|nr:hypothetical protein [Chloroflexota bacterium]
MAQVAKEVAEEAAEITVPIREVTREEGLAIIDRQARRYLNMSGEEFARRWRAGEFKDDPDQPGMMHVVMLLPLGE